MRKGIRKTTQPIKHKISLRRKLSLFKFRIKRKMVRPLILLIKKYEIREDFFKIYQAQVEELYNNPKLKKRTSPIKNEWIERTIIFGKDAIRIDPHKIIIEFLNKIIKSFKFFDEISNHFLYYLLLFFLIILFLQQRDFMPFFGKINDLLFYFLFFLFILTIVLTIYQKSLIWDTELFQLVNLKLRYNKLDLYGHRRYRRLTKKTTIVMAIWNKSLSDYRTISRIFFMLVLKIFFKPIYNYVLRSLIEILPKYLEEYMTTKDMKKINKSIWKDLKEKLARWRMNN
jgi:hypothetical protein